MSSWLVYCFQYNFSVEFASQWLCKLSLWYSFNFLSDLKVIISQVGSSFYIGCPF